LVCRRRSRCSLTSCSDRGGRSPRSWERRSQQVAGCKQTAKRSRPFNRVLLQSRQMPNLRLSCRNPTTISATEPEMLSSAGIEVWSLARAASLVLGGERVGRDVTAPLYRFSLGFNADADTPECKQRDDRGRDRRYDFSTGEKRGEQFGRSFELRRLSRCRRAVVSLRWSQKAGAAVQAGGRIGGRLIAGAQ